MKGKAGKALFLMFDEKTEALAKQAGLEVVFPPAKLRSWHGQQGEHQPRRREGRRAPVPYVLAIR
jgi:hypothetical protein